MLMANLKSILKRVVMLQRFYWTERHCVFWLNSLLWYPFKVIIADFPVKQEFSNSQFWIQHT